MVSTIRKTVCLALLTLALGACAGDDRPSGSAASATSAKGELVYFNPSYIPAGMKLANLDTSSQDDGSPTWWAKLGRADGDGFRDIALVYAWVSDKPAQDEYGPEFRARAKDIDVNGEPALLTDEPARGTDVNWRHGGYNVAVHTGPGQREVALDVARRVRMGPPGAIEDSSIDGAPEGLSFLGSSKLVSGGPTYSIELQNDADDSAYAYVTAVVTSKIRNTGIVGYGFAYEPWRSFRNGTATVHRWLDVYDDTSSENTNVVWAERPDLLVIVGGNIGRKEVLAIAKGLRAESKAAWRSHMPKETEE